MLPILDLELSGRQQKPDRCNQGSGRGCPRGKFPSEIHDRILPSAAAAATDCGGPVRLASTTVRDGRASGAQCGRVARPAHTAA